MLEKISNECKPRVVQLFAYLSYRADSLQVINNHDKNDIAIKSYVCRSYILNKTHSTRKGEFD